MEIKQVFANWLGQKQERSLIVGIDGLSGAGKTTLVEKLAEQVREAGFVPVILHIDDFITTRNVRYNDAYEDWYGYYVLQWRYDYLIENVLAPLRTGEDVRTQVEVYTHEIDGYRLADLEIGADSVVLLEGVFLQRPEVKPYLDHVMYLDVPQSVRLERMIRRDLGDRDLQAFIDKHDSRYFPAEDHYVVECEPTKHADLVIPFVDNEEGRS